MQLFCTHDLDCVLIGTAKPHRKDKELPDRRAEIKHRYAHVPHTVILFVMRENIFISMLLVTNLYKLPFPPAL